MNHAPTKLLLLVIAVLFSANLSKAAKILITETHNDQGAQLMDLNWRKASNILGHQPEIVHHDYLDSLHILLQADVLIIASGIKDISSSQKNNINLFLQSGGNIYVQSEFKAHFPGNMLFHYLVNKNGGSFEWEGELSFNLNPIQVKSFMYDTPEEAITLDYFWNGVYGCGGSNVIPFMEYQEKYFGFLYSNDNIPVGRVMTVSDQDWVKLATEVGKTERLVLMQRILKALVEGVPNLRMPEIQISGLQQSICLDTGFDIQANIDDTVLDYTLAWFKNGTRLDNLTNQNKFELFDLTDGDLVEAKILMNNHCDLIEIESNIIEIERIYPLSMSDLTIEGNTAICFDQPGVFVAISPDMPSGMNVQFQWTLNGQNLNLPMDTDTLRIPEPKFGDTIRLKLTYEDGCGTKELEASNEAIISIVGRPIPNIRLTPNKITYCKGEEAQLSLEGLYEDGSFDIEWYVNDQLVENNTKSHRMPSLNNEHQVRANVRYSDPCAGNISLSTQLVTVSVNQPLLTVISKKHTSCGFENGEIELQANGGQGPYIFNWNGDNFSPVITNLPQGQHQIHVIDANGCTDEITTEIANSNPKIIDSLVILAAACHSDEKAFVQLYPNSGFTTNLSLLWKRDDGKAIDVDFSEAELEPGTYEIIATVNDECTEVKRFEIKENDITSQFKTNFTVEEGQPLRLDLGVDPLEIKKISWSESEYLDCSDCKWPTFLADQSRVFEVVMATNAGCEYNLEVQVDVQKDQKLPFFAPNVFSPNNDAKNDLFEFFVDDSIESLEELLIFDRWGNEVFAANSLESVQWDGTQKGQPVTSGMYIYVARLINKKGEEITGNGTLLLTR